MCPPGVDQTMRTSQTWALFAPDIEQVHLLGGDREQYRFADFTRCVFQKTPPFDLWSLLAHPVLPTITPVQAASVQSGEIKGAFTKCSAEILELIIDAVEADKKSLLSLALTSTAMWNLIIARIYKSCVKEAAPWTNTRVLCQGNYSTSLPDTFAIAPEPERVPGQARRWGMCEARQFFWDHYGSEDVGSMEENFEGFRMAMSENRKTSEIREKVWDTLEKQLTPTLFPRDRTWVLQNLTKKEFICSDAMEGAEYPVPLPSRLTLNDDDGEEEDDGDESKALTESRLMTLEDIFLIKTHWSNITRSSMADLGCNEGDWAGDCFDLVTLDVHQLASERSDDAWKDVGESVVKFVGKARERLFGNGVVAHGDW